MQPITENVPHVAEEREFLKEESPIFGLSATCLPNELQIKPWQGNFQKRFDNTVTYTYVIMLYLLIGSHTFLRWRAWNWLQLLEFSFSRSKSCGLNFVRIVNFSLHLATAFRI